MLGQPLGEIERAGATDVVLQIAVQFGLKAGVRLGRLIGRVQFVDQRHQRLGHEAAAIGAEAPLGVRPGVGVRQGGVHDIGHTKVFREEGDEIRTARRRPEKL